VRVEGDTLVTHRVPIRWRPAGLVLLAAYSSVVLSAPSGVPEQEHALSGESLVAALKRGG